MSTEELQEFKKPIKKEMVEDEDDDFLKGEVPQNDTVIGITPSSLDPHFRSPSSSVGSPPVLYLPDQSPVSARICDWDRLPRIEPSGPRFTVLGVALNCSESRSQVKPHPVSEQTLCFVFIPRRDRSWEGWISCAIFYCGLDDTCWRLRTFSVYLFCATAFWHNYCVISNSSTLFFNRWIFKLT